MSTTTRAASQPASQRCSRCHLCQHARALYALPAFARARALNRKITKPPDHPRTERRTNGGGGGGDNEAGSLCAHSRTNTSHRHIFCAHGECGNSSCGRGPPSTGRHSSHTQAHTQTRQCEILIRKCVFGTLRMMVRT